MVKLETVKRATLAMQRLNWEQGTVAQAFLEAGDTDIAIMMAIEGVHRQIADGRCCQIGPAGAGTDPCVVGEALLYACEQTGDPDLIAGKNRLLAWALEKAPRNEQGVVYHTEREPQIWVDSFYMLPPFLARAGYYREAMCNLDGYWDVLINEKTGLLSQRWDDGAKKLLREKFWGVGNGWALAGMARVIALLPEEYAAERQRLIGRVSSLLDALLKLQEEDGMFHDTLDDPSTFKEVNCGQMIAYTIYRGVSEGWLSEELLPAAEKARAAAVAKVDRFGMVRDVAGIPHFDTPGIAAEGQAFYIMMEAAREKLSR